MNITLSKQLTPEEIADRIDWPVEKWPGNCYAVACAIYEAGLFQGCEPVYGMWAGPIAEGNLFSGRALARHGWLEMPDGTIVDPTRFVFESASPYIYIGESDHYDKAADGLRYGIFLARPKPDPGPKKFEIDFTYECNIFVGELLGEERVNEDDDYDDEGESYCNRYSNEQLFYLANAPLSILGKHAKEIFDALIANQLKAAIPLDCLTAVYGFRETLGQKK